MPTTRGAGNEAADAERTAGHASVGDSGGESSAPSLSKDEIFGILKNERRRQTLEFLEDNGGASTRGDVAEHIAARENGVDPAEITCSQRKRVYISLHQCHLPKMADVGVVDYDQTTGRVELRPASRLLFPYLRLDPAAAIESDARSESEDASGGVSDRVSDLVASISTRL